jgi:hypothetical protein
VKVGQKAVFTVFVGGGMSWHEACNAVFQQGSSARGRRFDLKTLVKRSFVLTVLMSAAIANASPPEGQAQAENRQKKVPPVVAAAEPAVELRVEGKFLRYRYDLSTLFDKQMWRVLEDNGYSEITVEVRLLDAGEKVRVSQYHTLKVELLDSGKVRVMKTARRGKIYKNREAAVADLTSVRGRPIRADEFGGEVGHMEVTVLVNPVQVFAFPDEEAPVADRQVVPRTYYDRKMELRSKRLTP